MLVLNTWGYVGLKPESAAGLKPSGFQKCLILFLPIAREGSSPSREKKKNLSRGFGKTLSSSRKKSFLCLYPWYNVYLLTKSQRTLLHLRDWFQNIGYAATTCSCLDTFWNLASRACSSLFSFLSMLYSCYLTLYRISLLYRVRLFCETSDETRKLQSKLSSIAASSSSPSSLSWHLK